MIINRHALLRAAPIKDMLTEKVRGKITSHGLSEAGYDIRIKQEVVFSPDGVYVNGDKLVGNFALASTIEEFQMPTDMVGVVHDKSTWARKGLSVFNTVIEPGFCGGLTLELVYHCREILTIPPGSGIAQVLFYETKENASYCGKYQNQSTDPVPAIYG